MYDLDNSGAVTRDELLVILQMMVGSNITEEQLGSIADRTIAEADEDATGAITYENFAKVSVYGLNINLTGIELQPLSIQLHVLFDSLHLRAALVGRRISRTTLIRVPQFG